MNSFLYFAYGSNMLAARLIARCPSAVPVGTAVAGGHRLDFCKKGADGSGKATLVPSENCEVHGVLFRIARRECELLDRAEGRYGRDDAFTVQPMSGEGAPIPASTYIARREACLPGLRPFDWYLALICAGAREHDLDKAYRQTLEAVPVRRDWNRWRSAQMQSLLWKT